MASWRDPRLPRLPAVEPPAHSMAFAEDAGLSDLQPSMAEIARSIGESPCKRAVAVLSRARRRASTRSTGAGAHAAVIDGPRAHKGKVMTRPPSDLHFSTTFVHRRRASRLQRSTTSAILVAGMLGMGCGTYYNETSSSAALVTTKTIKFNQRLPNAMEDLFAQCHDPLVLKRHQVHPLGSCEGQPFPDYGGVENQVLALALATEGNLDFRPVFPASLVNSLQEIHGFEGFPWPIQNCEVFLDLDMELLGLGLVDLDASWVTHDGSAALHIDFDRDTSFPFITGSIEGDVDCPSALNEPFIQGSLPNGDYDITVSGVDIDIWVMFDVVGGAIVTSVDSDVDLGAISISPALSNKVLNNVGDIEDILEDVSGRDLAQMEADANDNLADQLAGIVSALDDELNGEIDDDATVQSAQIVNGKLHITTTQPVVLTPKPNWW